MAVLDNGIKKEFDNVYSRINKNTDEISEIDKRVAILETLLKGLTELPECFHELKETLIGVQTSLKNLEAKTGDIEEQLSADIGQVKKTLRTQESRGKIDIIQFISENWFKIITGIVTVSFILKEFVVH